MSDKAKYVADKRPLRVDRDRLMKGPSAADLREMPATTAVDWKSADVLIPIDEATYRDFERFRATRRKKTARS